MRLSISSSDRRFLGTLGLWTAVLAVAANVATGYAMQHWDRLDRRLEMPNFDVPANLENYALNYRQCPVVVLGSSVVGGLPPPGWEKPGICSITLVGQGSLVGLEVMSRLPNSVPRVLFVESSFGFRDASAEEIAAATDPVPRAIRNWFPLATASANWVNMLWKIQFPVPTQLWHPAERWEEWRALRKPYSDIYVQIYGHPVDDWGKQHLDDNLARTKALIAEIESRGTTVIFFDSPLDPWVAELPIIALWTDKMHAAFPDHEWVSDAPEKYRLSDGMHFTSGSGEDFFELLLSHLPEDGRASPKPAP
jgi:hypothetical protein